VQAEILGWNGAWGTWEDVVLVEGNACVRLEGRITDDFGRMGYGKQECCQTSRGARGWISMHPGAYDAWRRRPWAGMGPKMGVGLVTRLREVCRVDWRRKEPRRR
jgi:hypothetical protein